MIKNTTATADQGPQPAPNLTVWGVLALALLYPSAILADDEAGNLTTSAWITGEGCSVRSIPKYPHDPTGEVRQQGRTEVYLQTDQGDLLVQTYDWYSGAIHALCGPDGDVALVRHGPWHRGHVPKDDHLAMAFYRNGQMLARYSTLDIAGGEQTKADPFQHHKNTSVSVSHYTVFQNTPEAARSEQTEGDGWMIVRRTVDHRTLTFDGQTGALVSVSRDPA